MSYKSYNSDQMNIISKVLDDHCSTHGIQDQGEREGVASLLMAMFNEGVNTEAMLAAGLAGIARQKQRQA